MKSDFYMLLGENIVRLRTKQGFGPEELADHLDVTLGYWLLVERGRRHISVEQLIKLCFFFGCTAEYLLMGEEWQDT